jgi:hypothetical protein
MHKLKTKRQIIKPQNQVNTRRQIATSISPNLGASVLRQLLASIRLASFSGAGTIAEIFAMF